MKETSIYTLLSVQNGQVVRTGEIILGSVVGSAHVDATDATRKHLLTGSENNKRKQKKSLGTLRESSTISDTRLSSRGRRNLGMPPDEHVIEIKGDAAWRER